MASAVGGVSLGSTFLLALIVTANAKAVHKHSTTLPVAKMEEEPRFNDGTPIRLGPAGLFTGGQVFRRGTYSGTVFNTPSHFRKWCGCAPPGSPRWWLGLATFPILLFLMCFKAVGLLEEEVAAHELEEAHALELQAEEESWGAIVGVATAAKQWVSNKVDSWTGIQMYASLFIPESTQTTPAEEIETEQGSFREYLQWTISDPSGPSCDKVQTNSQGSTITIPGSEDVDFTFTEYEVRCKGDPQTQKRGGEMWSAETGSTSPLYYFHSEHPIAGHWILHTLTKDFKQNHAFEWYDYVQAQGSDGDGPKNLKEMGVDLGIISSEKRRCFAFPLPDSQQTEERTMHRLIQGILEAPDGTMTAFDEDDEQFEQRTKEAIAYFYPPKSSLGAVWGTVKAAVGW